MSVTRLSPEALNKILSGKVREDATCVIKFYSNDCHLCQNLHDYYIDISQEESYSDILFFAFNVDDNQMIEKKLKFNGVPTISVVKTYSGETKPRVRILSDPDNPQPQTWYTVRYIKDFIEREK